MSEQQNKSELSFASMIKGALHKAGVKILYFVIMGFFLFIGGWFALSYVTDLVMSPFRAAEAWMTETKVAVVETVETGAKAAGEAVDSTKTAVGNGLVAAKDAVGAAKDAVENGASAVKDAGGDVLERAKDLLSADTPPESEVAAADTPETAKETTPPPASCWKDWVPFFECEVAQ